MNERKGYELGLEFHGATANEWRPEEIKELKQKAKEIRKLGFQARVIKSGRNEWGGGSYLLFVDSEYKNYERAKSNLYYIKNEEEYIRHIQEEAEKKIQEIKEKAQKFRELADKYGIKY